MAPKPIKRKHAKKVRDQSQINLGCTCSVKGFNGLDGKVHHYIISDSICPVHGAPRAPSTKPPRKYRISVDRILKINNDIAEDMNSGSPTELLEVIKYLGDQLELEGRARWAMHDMILTSTLEHMNNVLAKLKDIEHEHSITRR